MTMTYAEAQQRVHEAIGHLLDDDEFAMSWVLTIDVAGDNDIRYLAHRAGGGVDGTDFPMAWTALGMLEASVGIARRQIDDMTFPHGAEDDDDEDPEA